MANNVTLPLTGTGDATAKAVTDDCGVEGHAQVIKLGIATAASRVLIPADATDGLLVNLGANNDVTVTSGTLTAVTTITNPVTVNAHAVTNAGVFATQVDGAALTALQLIDDAVYASDGVLNKSVVIGAVLDDVATVPITENQGGYLRMSSRRALLVEGVASGTVIPTSLASTTITGTVALVANQSVNVAQINGVAPTMGTGISGTGVQRVTLATDIALPTGSNVIGALTANQSVNVAQMNGVAVTMGNGISGTGVQRVTLASDSTGVLATVSTVTAVTTITNDVKVVGNTADDLPASGAPVPIGAVARQTNRTAVADGDVVRVAADDIGRQVTVIGQVRDLMTDAHTQIASSSAETTILAAAASTFHDMTQLVITNQTATAVNVTIRDVAAGSARMIIALAASGGAVIPFHRPVKQATVNTAWTAQLSSAAVTVNFYIQAEKNV